jgi:hypothetical protein
MKREIPPSAETGFDDIYYWSGNTDLLAEMIKRVEDRMNIHFDSKHAGIRVILLVEDSPLTGRYLSITADVTTFPGGFLSGPKLKWPTRCAPLIATRSLPSKTAGATC